MHQSHIIIPFMRAASFIGLICILCTSCKAPPAHYPVLQQQLQSIPLQTHDIGITHLRPLPDEILPPVAAGFKAPLPMPDMVQLLAESILSQQHAIIPISATTIAPLYGGKGRDTKKPSRTKLTNALRGLRRHYHTEHTYEHVLTWAENYPVEFTDLLAALIKSLDHAHRTLMRATQKLSPAEREELITQITQLSLHPIGSENTLPFNHELLDLCNRVDQDAIIAETFSLLRVVQETKNTIQSMDQLPVIPESFSFETPLGTIIIGSTTDDHYTENACLIVDFLGDDSYMEQSGQLPDSRIKLIIDYKGNDIYRTHESNSFASAVMGISVLYDHDGHDFYTANDMSIATGILGAGVLIDEHGDDEFKMNQCGIGAGIYGLGILYNKKGNDYYYGKHYCQAFSMTRGIGLLIDFYGNDFYSAGGEYDGWAWSEESYKSSSQGFSMGIREYAPGGFSYLLDATGNDLYHGSTLCQGAGYWFGLGVLHDIMGNDFYTSYHYAQGAGVHSAIGILLDNEGADMYKSHAASQGLGYHQSIGILVDYKGNDHYSAKQLSAGSGSLLGCGILNDKQGNDSYQIQKINENSLGRGTVDNAIPSIGLFFDEHGQDYYVEAPHFQNASLPTGRYSMRSDGEQPLDMFTTLPLFVPRKATPKSYYAQVDASVLSEETTPQQLYAIITNESIMPATRAQAARMLQKGDADAMAFIIDCIRSPSYTTSRTFPAQYVKSFGEDIISILITEITQETEDHIKAKLCHYLQYSRNTATIVAFTREQLSKRQGPETTIALLKLTLHFRDLDAEESCSSALQSDNVFVVMQALKTIQALKLAGTIPHILPLLAHEHFYVREQAAHTLLSFGDVAMQHLEEEYTSATGTKKDSIVDILERHRGKYR